MKRFWVFSGPIYYAAGGWQDFIGDADDVAAAIEVARKEIGGSWAEPEDLAADYWWHVVDGTTFRIIAGSERQAHGGSDFSDLRRLQNAERMTERRRSESC